jgi:hypothetical protein
VACLLCGVHGALGDVSAADQNKGAGAAGRQAPVVAGNIRALITGEDALARYEPPAELKGRDMMVGRFAELLGLST